MFDIFTYPKFYLMQLAVPAMCLMPDFTLKHGRAIFFPFPSERIMFEQKKTPHYSFYENYLKSEFAKSLAGVIKNSKNAAYLNSKALSEIEKKTVMSQGKRSLDDFSVFTT